MAARRPLIVVNGEVQELSDADYLSFLAGAVGFVTVVNPATDARPTFGFGMYLWIGGATEPVNMGPDDYWIHA